jgi:hypothetical protein
MYENLYIMLRSTRNFLLYVNLEFTLMFFVSIGSFIATGSRVIVIPQSRLGIFIVVFSSCLFVERHIILADYILHTRVGKRRPKFVLYTIVVLQSCMTILGILISMETYVFNVCGPNSSDPLCSTNLCPCALIISGLYCIIPFTALVCVLIPSARNVQTIVIPEFNTVIPYIETTESDCSICLVTNDNITPLVKTGCNHIFHEACLDRLRNYGYTSCPNCRSAL